MADFQRTKTPCKRCGITVTGATEDTRYPTECGKCITSPPQWDSISAPFEYYFPLPQLINQFKHHRREEIGKILADTFQDEICPAATSLSHKYALKIENRPTDVEKYYKDAVLCPIPLHSWRLLQRGFNQATLLAHAWGKHYGLTVRPLLRKQGPISRQQGASRQQRRARQLDFQVPATQKHWLKGRHVILVDDVVTTGSTVTAASCALKQAGAARVDVWALARVQPHTGLLR